MRRYPRKAPKAIASGISFRDGDLGSAKAVELIKVCDFYESKASGEYVDSALSGRYVHAMAKEVRTLACALKAGEDEQKARIRELEVCCREWDEHFGPSSDARGRLTRAAQGELRIVPATPASLSAERAWLLGRVEALEVSVAESGAALEREKARGAKELEDHVRAARAFAARH